MEDFPSLRPQKKYTYIHTYIHFFKSIILSKEPQKHRNSSKSLIRKFEPLQSFLFEKAIVRRSVAFNLICLSFETPMRNL